MMTTGILLAKLAPVASTGRIMVFRALVDRMNVSEHFVIFFLLNCNIRSRIFLVSQILW